jgi:hypothetical protein
LNKYASIGTFTANMAVVLAVITVDWLAFKGFTDGRPFG